MDIGNEYGCLEAQKTFLPLLKDFDDFCLSNDIKYALDCGSLLGVIRHQGFIPWDDDMDFAISREDMIKLEKEIAKSSNLKLVKDLWFYRVTYKESCCPIECKEVPEITFFIFDKSPENRFSQKLKMILLLILQQTFKVFPSGKGIPFGVRARLFLGWLLGAPFTHNFKFKVFNWLCSSLGSEKFVSCYGYWPSQMMIRHSSDYMKNLKRIKFENIETYIPTNYEEQLTDMYGDYMTPPNVEDRVTTHRSDQAWVQ